MNNKRQKVGVSKYEMDNVGSPFWVELKLRKELRGSNLVRG